jgi:hypothetical protein
MSRHVSWLRRERSCNIPARFSSTRGNVGRTDAEYNCVGCPHGAGSRRGVQMRAHGSDREPRIRT